MGRTLLNNGLAKLHTLNERMVALAIEREISSRVSVEALISRHHVLYLGPPGAAKSLMARMIAHALDLPDNGYFEALMGKGLPPDAILGPPDIEGAVKDRDYRRVIEGFIATAYIIFLDEIFKTGDVNVNPTLTVLNERLFQNGRTVHKCPLITGYFASNELYDGMALEAFFSRLTYRLWVDYIQEDDNVDLLLDAYVSQATGGGYGTEDIGITVDELDVVHGEMKAMPFGSTQKDILKTVRKSFRAEGMLFDDRKLCWMTDVVRARAVFEGHAEPEPEDFSVLEHLLWNDPKDRAKVRSLVLTVCNPAQEEADAYVDDARTAVANARAQIATALTQGDKVAKQQAAADVDAKVDEILQTIERRVKETSGATKETMEAALDKVDAQQEIVVREIVGLRARRERDAS